MQSHDANAISVLGHQRLVPPSFFKGYAGLTIVGVLAYIMVSIFFAPSDQPLYHFSEDGAIDRVSGHVERLGVGRFLSSD